MKHLLFGIAILLFSSCSGTSDPVKSDFEYADKQLRVMLNDCNKVLKETGKTMAQTPVPRDLKPTGELQLTSPYDWVSGFFPGVLWYMYEYTQDPFWKEKAETYTEPLACAKTASTHDLGFMLYCSFGNGYRLTQSDEYKKVLLVGAETLAKRFNPVVGCTRSWDSNTDKWQYPVIIDNMMNLELLFWASKVSGDPKYRDIAIKHADTTLKNHFRKDFSSYHVIDYDTITGEVRHKHTHQGYAHESAWARGQSWGLYGYTMCYRETKDPKYLQQAEHIADFILSHPRLPKDMVPFWDFDAPNIPDAPRDASAAAVAASGLYELSTFSANGDKYRHAADNIMHSLSTIYRPELGTKHGFLLHSSTGHMPNKSQINVPIIYADYYYIEALIRKNKLN